MKIWPDSIPFGERDWQLAPFRSCPSALLTTRSCCRECDASQGAPCVLHLRLRLPVSSVASPKHINTGCCVERTITMDPRCPTCACCTSHGLAIMSANPFRGHFTSQARGTYRTKIAEDIRLCSCIRRSASLRLTCSEHRSIRKPDCRREGRVESRFVYSSKYGAVIIAYANVLRSTYTAAAGDHISLCDRCRSLLLLPAPVGTNTAGFGSQANQLPAQAAKSPGCSWRAPHMHDFAEATAIGSLCAIRCAATYSYRAANLSSELPA